MTSFTLELRTCLRPTYIATLALEDADHAKRLALRFLSEVIRDEPHVLDDGPILVRVTEPEGGGFNVSVRIEDRRS